MDPSNRTRFDTLAPDFRLLINGSEISDDAMANLVAVNVLDDVDASSMFSCTLVNWDQIKSEPKWLDDGPFKEGNSVEVKMGYKDTLRTLFKGEITGLEPEFTHRAPPTLTARGYDRCHRLMRKRKTRSFRNMKDSDIATQIAADAGLTPQTEDTNVTLDYVLQHNQTDFDFLRERARRIGYEVLAMDRALHFRPRQISQSASLTLAREVELLEFRPRLTTVGQVGEVRVQGWNPKDKKELVAQSAAGQESTLMGGSVSGPSATNHAFQETGGVSVHLPVHSQAEADQIARGWFGEMALSYITGSGLCIGQPDLRAGSIVKIEGLGQRFSGLYYVTASEHTYKPRTGYRTAFSVRRNAT